MKLTVLTYGTEGDTRPLVALCRALMDAGPETHLLADRATPGSAEALGVPAAALSGDIRAALMPPAAQASKRVPKAHFRTERRSIGGRIQRVVDLQTRVDQATIVDETQFHIERRLLR